MAEAWRNLTAAGARPLAITDNMNFGNPEKPEIMGQFAAAIRGMAAACEALDFPVVSRQCQPLQRDRGPRRSCRPRRSAASACSRMRRRRVGLALAPRLDLVLIGETTGWLGQSLWLREIAGREDGAPPPVDLAAERRNGDFVRAQIVAGGIAPATTCRMAGCWWPWPRWRWPAHTGFALEEPPEGAAPGFWFGEDQARYLIAAADASGLLSAARCCGRACPAARPQRRE